MARLLQLQSLQQHQQDGVSGPNGRDAQLIAEVEGKIVNEVVRVIIVWDITSRIQSVIRKLVQLTMVSQDALALQENTLALSQLIQPINVNMEKDVIKSQWTPRSHLDASTLK